MAMLNTFLSLSVSILLGAVSLAGVSVSGVAMVQTKKYQKKLAKVTELVDIVTSALAVFERSVSKALNDGKVDEWEFTMLHTFPLGVLNELAKVDHKMESETRTQLQNSLREEFNNLKKTVRKSNAS